MSNRKQSFGVLRESQLFLQEIAMFLSHLARMKIFVDNFVTSSLQ